MATLLSPGVNVSEIDLTTIVPAVSTSVGAIAGLFHWGPVGQRVLVDSEKTLYNMFQKPTGYNAETWFTAANFLSYTNALYVVRAANTSGAVSNGTFTSAANSTVSNNVFVLTSGNTSGIFANMFVTQTSNSTVAPAGNTVTVASVVNSTAITLSSNTNSNSQVTLYFGWPYTTYTAVGLEPGAYSANLVNQIVINDNAYAYKKGLFDNGVTWLANYPGEFGNSIRVSVVDNANTYASNVALGNTTVNGSFSLSTGSNLGDFEFSGTGAGTFANNVIASLTIGDQIKTGNSSIGIQYMKVVSIGNTYVNGSNTAFAVTFDAPYRLTTTYSSNTVQRQWEFFNVFGTPPGQSAWQAAQGNTYANDEMHLVVVDNLGKFTGVPGTILESYKGLSRATNAKNLDTTTNYYVNVINQQSQYIYWGADRPNAPSNNATNLISTSTTVPGNYYFTLGQNGYDESTVALSTISSAYDLFSSKEDVDVSIILQGRPLGGTTSSGGQTVYNYLLSNYIVQNIVDGPPNPNSTNGRKDCVAVISPDKTTTINNVGQEATSLVNWRNVIGSSSYAVMDSGYKYQYDRYNDIYRWVPLNGDIGGLMARTDNTNDAWWSPAGYNRGQIKNVVKLAYNPRQADRDLLYVNGVNPVVTFPGQGTVLYGDKTLQSKPSAFDRINVRRLFIVLEKAISLAAKYSLFEFNDTFTQNQFKNTVIPYLRQIQGKRGITDFLVVCDATNNTPAVVDANQFVGDIYIKPARSINFIQLNFVAVGTGVQFSTVVGQF